MRASSLTQPLMADSLSETDRRKVARFVESQSGILCPASKHSLVEGRLRRRQRSLGFSTLGEYVNFVLETKQGESERIHMLDALTTNKTDFYREAEHFSFLNHYLTSILQNSGENVRSRVFRLWSAGCSTGEEPYTLAIEMNELQLRHPAFRFSILASDISQRCLQKARTAIYTRDRIEPMPTVLRRRYLLRSRDKSRNLVQIAPELKQQVSFQSFNLLKDNYRSIGKVDVIFCRNVMIYFNNHDREYIAGRFARVLNPKGLLILGHSESLIGNEDDYQRLQPTIYQRVNAAGERR